MTDRRDGWWVRWGGGYWKHTRRRTVSTGQDIRWVALLPRVEDAVAAVFTRVARDSISGRNKQLPIWLNHYPGWCFPGLDLQIAQGHLKFWEKGTNPMKNPPNG